MKKFLNVFFVTLGVIFLVLLIGISGFFLINRFWGVGGGSFTPGQQNISKQENGTSTSSGTSFSLTTGQAAALKTFGIDPNSVSNITPEQEACFVEALGQARVNEIKGGAIPTFSDFMSAKGCL